MKSINQIDIAGKRVLLRTDFNVPMDKETGRITDDTRVRAHLPTIRYILEQGAKLVIVSHLGRPKGKPVEALSLEPVSVLLSNLLERPVAFVDESIGEKATRAVAGLKPGEALLLENLRFHPGEEANDPAFAKQLAAFCDVYVDDAFAVSHRAAASNTAIAGFVPASAAGYLLRTEIEYLHKITGNPERPLVAIIGGAKVSDKIGVLEKLIEKVDRLLIGGGMAFTFLKAAGHGIGKSLCEENMLDLARAIAEKAERRNVRLLLPVDCVVASAPAPDAETRICGIDEIPADMMGLDIGPKSVALFAEALRDARTIVWNGPLGMFELMPFRRGTFDLIHIVAGLGVTVIVGGGDTDTAVHQAGESAKITYISTGGGAFLELLEGKTLPGVAALEGVA